ncbi:preprotein translocase subunit SecE, partial [Turicimonas muris]|uniref:preprotein translocase subunit SecE n=1 Tax=Turicimonas muris TaxID=1796652 RepID=UPI00263A3CAB
TGLQNRVSRVRVFLPVPITKNMKLFKDIKESYNELVYKVSWPTQKQLINSSVLVLIASIILAVFIWAVDKIFNLLMELVYSISF